MFAVRPSLVRSHRAASFVLTVFMAVAIMAGWPHTAAAQENDAMLQGTSPANPIFVKATSWAQLPDDRFAIELSMDNDKCRAHYGDQNYWRGCRRRLGLDGRRADEGVTITPAVAGEWRWQGDYSLVFTPAENWKSGTNYRFDIDLDRLGASDSVVLSGGNARAASVHARSADLSAEIDDMQYMQDPEDPKKRVVTGRITLNYPVTPEALKSRITFAMDAGSNASKDAAHNDFEFTMPNDHKSAIVTYPVTGPGAGLPEADTYLTMRVGKGLPPEFGGAVSSEDFEERARVPSLKTWLAVDRLEAVIARGQDGTPAQSIAIETNVKAKPADVLSHVTAYLLPEFHPAALAAQGETAAKPKPHAWKAENEVTPEILALSEKLVPALPKDAAAQDYSTATALNIAAPAKRYVYVTIGAGLPAFGGYTLEKPRSAILQMPDWPVDMDIMQEGSILSLNGAKTLSLHARGTDMLEARVAQIMPSALHHFITQTEGDISKPDFRNWTFGAEDIAEIDTATIKMAYASPFASQYAAFDFGPYLKDGRKGIFLIGLTGKKDGKTIGRTENRFVLVTDLGLIAKTNADKTRDVFVASFDAGKPVDGVEIAVLGRNGLEVFAAKTDKAGHAALPDLSGFDGGQEPVAIVARKGEDLAFLPFDRQDRQINTSRFDVGGNRIAAEGLSAYGFTDRGIYRPGEVAHIAFIVRDAQWTKPGAAPLPTDLPLKLIVTDPRGRSVMERTLHFGADGFESFDFATKENAATGLYTAALYIARDDEDGAYLGEATMKVEDFQPDRLKITTVFKSGDADVSETQGWVKPDGVLAQVTLLNLYGTPASNRKVTGNVTLAPARLQFETWPDYTFHDAYPAKPRHVAYPLGETKTDAEGKASLKLLIERQDAATYVANVETRGFDAGGGRGVAAYSTVTVSPMDFAIGHKSAGRLSFLKKDAQVTVDVVAVAPDLSPVAAQGLEIVLYARSYVSSLIRRGDGSYAYESIARVVEKDRRALSVPAGGVAITLPTDTIGDFTYRIEGKDGIVHADIPFAVTGDGMRKGGIDKETTLQVKLAKERVMPGEELEMAITAPFAGAGLITIEGESVAAYQWFHAATTDSVQKIKVPEDFSGKGYVSIAYLRDINAKEIYASPLSTAIVPFTADPAAQTMALRLSVPDVVKPGESFEVTYGANKKGRALIFAVDAGILQVARYERPDPIGFFLMRRALQVETAQMLDLLMPEYAIVKELSATGGDAAAMDAAMGKHANPFRRKTLAPAVYWSGFVEAGPEDKRVTITPPGHFNGTMRVFIVAAGAAGTDGVLGSAEDEVTVRGDIVVTPVVPNALSPGDMAVVSATIANNLPKEDAPADMFTFEIGLTGGLESVPPLPQETQIPRGAEDSIAFSVTATQDLGNADITVAAQTGAGTGTGAEVATQRAEASLSVRPAAPYETRLLSGYEAKGDFEVAMARDLFPQRAERAIAVSALPLPFIAGLERYLDGFAYGCTEQIVSKVMPQIALSGLEAYDSGSDRAANFKEKAAEAVDTLRARQTDEGGFSLWDGGYEADDLATLHALEFLTRARAAGVAVPSDLIQSAQRYMREWVNREITGDDDARAKAQGIYLMTLGGYVTTNEILHLIDYYDEAKADWRRDISGLYIASAYAMMRQQEMAEAAITAFGDYARGLPDSYGRGWSDTYNPFIIKARYVALLAEHFPARMDEISPELIRSLAGYIKEDRYNTLSSGYAIAAFAAYARHMDAAIAKADITVSADGKAVTDGILPVDAKSVKVKVTPAMPVYYTVTETGYDKGAATATTPVAQGMEISRAFTAADGSPMSDGAAVRLGDVIEATITIRATAETIENVAIVDILPAGFVVEADYGAFTGLPGSSFTPAFTQRLEDRIVLFGDIGRQERSFKYRLRAAAKGKFVAAPVFAEAMYNITQVARGTAMTLTVSDE